MSEPASFRLKTGLAEMLKGGVIMDVTDADQARIAERSGACAVMALERVPADIRAEGGVARMAPTRKITEIQAAVSIPVMAKARIGHFAEAQVLQSLEVDYIDESEVLTPADESHHIDKLAFDVPFVCGATNLGEALRRIGEGAAMIRSKGEAGTGNIVEAVRHMREITGGIKTLATAGPEELSAAAKEHRAPLEVVRVVAEAGRLPVPLFCAGGIATPADAALMVQLGAEGNFVGSGIFKSSDPERRARAIVEATTHARRPRAGRRGVRRAGRGDAGPGDLGAGCRRRPASRPRCLSPRRGRRRSRPAELETRLAIGVLAVQGDFEAHGKMLRGLGAEVREVRTPEDLTELDGLVIPGGESTTITMGISSAGLEPGIRRHHDGGRPILGTCAGMIVCDDAHLGLIDAHARRNAFGRQLQSFETDLRVEGLGEEPLRAVFIRAPWIERTGPGVEVLAAYQRPPGGDPRGLGAELRLPPRTERRSARPRAVHGNGDLRGRAEVAATGGGEQLKDPRVQGLARILVGYSTKVKPGEIVSIDGESAAEPLLAALYEEVLKAGANPILNMSLDGQAATYFKHAGDAQLDWVSPVAEWMVENVDVRLSVGASTNTRELSAVPPERQTRRQAAMGELMSRAMERSAEGGFRWCYTLFPTSAYASEAEMSTRGLRGLLLRRPASPPTPIR